MSVTKTAHGRWRARVKIGRDGFVGSKTFDRRADAVAWEAAERAKYTASGAEVDPRAGRQRICDVIPAFLEFRYQMVSASTVATDKYLLSSSTPDWLLLRSVASVTAKDVERAYMGMVKAGSPHGSISRWRTSFSAFMGWAIRQGMRVGNPVLVAVMARRTEPEREMRP